METLKRLALPLVLGSCVPEMEQEVRRPRAGVTTEVPAAATEVDLVQNNIKETLSPKVFDLMGEEEFTTKVDGYFMARTEVPTFEDIDVMGEDADLPIAYFVINAYEEPGFEQSLKDLQSVGNTLNTNVKDKIAFRLGCKNATRILNQNGDMTYDQSGAIMHSTPSDPLTIGLQFEIGNGGDYSCSSMADNIFVIGKATSR